MTILPREAILLQTVLVLLSVANVAAKPYMMLTTSNQKCVFVDVPGGTNLLVKYEAPDLIVLPEDDSETRSSPRRRLTEADQPGYAGGQDKMWEEREKKKKEASKQAWENMSFEQLEQALAKKKKEAALDTDQKKKELEALDAEQKKKEAEAMELANAAKVSSEEVKQMEAVVERAAGEAKKIRDINLEMQKKAAEEKKGSHAIGKQEELDAIEKELEDQLKRIKDFGQFKVPPHPGMDEQRADEMGIDASEHLAKLESMQNRMNKVNERVGTKLIGQTQISIRETSASLTEFFHLPRHAYAEHNGRHRMATGLITKKEGALDEFLPHNSGVVEICVTVHGATVKNPSRIFLEVSDLKKPRPKAPEQGEIHDHLEELEEQLWDLNEEVENILLEADYAKDQEVVFHRHSVDMNSAATWWPMIQVSILLLTGLVYANHLVAFFKRHNIV